MDGSRFERAAKETTVLSTERSVKSLSTAGGLARVLDSFVFVVDGKPCALSKDLFERQDWQNVRVIGAIASLLGKDKLLAQCGWFHRIIWLWVDVVGIKEIRLKSDSRYRGGEPCLWMVTSIGEYALLSPHKRYTPMWEQTLIHIGPEAIQARFHRCPPEGPIPAWWDPGAKNLWPDPTAMSKSSPSKKRPPPVDISTLAGLSLESKKNHTDENVAFEGDIRRVKPREDKLQVPTPGIAGTGTPWGLEVDTISKPAWMKAPHV